jgi:hypothetical protein
MGGYFSDNYHVVNALSPVADAFATSATSDIVNLAKYSSVTFIISTGVSTTADGVVTVLAGTSVSSATNAVPFKYRTVLAPATTNVPAALTQATASGFSMTASKANSFYIVEVNAEDLAPTYTTCALKVTEVTNDPQTASIVAILGKPRYGAQVDGIIA